MPPAQLEQLTTRKSDGFPDIRTESRTHVKTAVAAHWLGRQEQTGQWSTWLQHWGRCDLLALITAAKQVRAINARLVWTRYRPNTKLAQELSELATKELGLAALSTTLGMRVTYMQALGEGLTVAELADQSAKVEARSLVEEVKKLLKVKP
ncbi:hypothetical protein [Rhodoferax antarcticus]|uniref:hypothetical protein n=1 Tax=Rhodoferax antarcticus TaxID=81479 RepID=UPI0022242244|nr:hypothetical protein [Rhodoferax antarcticus]MCW2312161.1 hypothetical protein [Rhodoferax antarcticus]